MDLKRGKYAIEFQSGDAINRNRFFFDFMLRMFNHLTQLYVEEKSLLIDKILKYQLMDESEKKIKKPNRHVS